MWIEVERVVVAFYVRISSFRSLSLPSLDVSRVGRTSLTCAPEFFSVFRMPGDEYRTHDNKSWATEKNSGKFMNCEKKREAEHTIPRDARGRSWPTAIQSTRKMRRVTLSNQWVPGFVGYFQLIGRTLERWDAISLRPVNDVFTPDPSVRQKRTRQLYVRFESLTESRVLCVRVDHLVAEDMRLYPWRRIESVEYREDGMIGEINWMNVLNGRSVLHFCHSWITRRESNMIFAVLNKLNRLITLVILQI